MDHEAGEVRQSEYRAALAARLVSILEDILKAAGTLPMSEQESLEAELNARFPKAKSKEVVEYKGHQYRCRYEPSEFSRSRKKVTQWRRRWELIEYSSAVQ